MLAKLMFWALLLGWSAALSMQFSAFVLAGGDRDRAQPRLEDQTAGQPWYAAFLAANSH